MKSIGNSNSSIIGFATLGTEKCVGVMVRWEMVHGVGLLMYAWGKNSEKEQEE
jgi:hypothetical protein